MIILLTDRSFLYFDYLRKIFTINSLADILSLRVIQRFIFYNMNFIDLVIKRRSIRNYSSRAVSRDLLDKLFESARLAPSACNRQPWFFVAIDDPGLKNAVAVCAFSGIYSINKFAQDAPVLVAVVRESSGCAVSLAGFLKGTKYSLIDIGMACEHFALSAEDQGLGTCFLGWFNEKKVKKILNIPKQRKIDMLISVGYPKNSDTVDKIRKSLDEIRIYR